MKKYILTLDVGGTTFSSYLIDEDFQIRCRSLIDKIVNYSNKEELINGIENQILDLLNNYNVSLSEILCLGISAPGPLNSEGGFILNTPNLIMLQNTPIIKLLNDKFTFPIFLENDANLFALGEWSNYYKKDSIIVGITLGTGLGLGVVINGQLFTGAHGMGAEYGISPYKAGVWEDTISIKGLEKLIYKRISKKISPKELFQLAFLGNTESIEIWHDFGSSLGIFTSHILNILDPSVVSFGGGISKAFDFFSESLIRNLNKFSPTYNYNNPIITYSKKQLDSTHTGAAIFALEQLLKK